MISPSAQRVAAEIRAELARQRKTQGDLARVLGISQQAVSRRVTGQHPFDVDQLGRISEWLGVPLGQLIGTTAVA